MSSPTGARFVIHAAHCVEHSLHTTSADRHRTRPFARRCMPNASGVALGDVARALEELGYVTIPFELRRTEALKRLKCPCILPGPVDHFVVLVPDASRGGLNIYDPPSSLWYAGADQVESLQVGRRGVAVLPAGTSRQLSAAFATAQPSLLNGGALAVAIVAALLVLTLWRFRSHRADAAALGLAALVICTSLPACGDSSTAPKDEALRRSDPPRAQDTVTKDLGTVLVGQPIECVFDVRNDATSDATITRAVFLDTCRCNVGEVTLVSTVAAPGEAFRVRLISEAGNRIGRIVRTGLIEIHSASGDRQVGLEATATVANAVRAVPSALSLGTFEPGSHLGKCFSVVSGDGRDLSEQFVRATCTADGIGVLRVSSRPDCIEFQVAPTSEVPFGDFSGVVNVELASEDVRVLEVPIAGRCQGPLTVTPRRVLVRRGIPACVRVRADDLGFRVMSVSCPEWLHVEGVPSQTSSVHDLLLSATEAAGVAAQPEECVVVTDHPAQSRVVFRVVPLLR